jgi:integrase
MHPDTARQVLAALKARRQEADFMVFESLLSAGMRTDELCRLTADGVDPVKGTIKVLAAKGSDDHEVPIDSKLAEALHAHLTAFQWALGHRSRASDLDSRKRQLRALWSRVSVRLGLAGQGYSLHSLRSAFAMLILERTGNAFLVQQLLGHRSIASTMSYVRMSQIEAKRGDILAALAIGSCDS